MPFITENARKKYDDLIETLISKVARSANETIPEENAKRTMKTHATYILYKLLFDLFLQDDKVNMMFDIYAVQKAVDNNISDFFNNVEKQILTERWVNRH